jgi:hypothetical protein
VVQPKALTREERVETSDKKRKKEKEREKLKVNSNNRNCHKPQYTLQQQPVQPGLQRG